jgi:hypothetical protein
MVPFSISSKIRLSDNIMMLFLLQRKGDRGVFAELMLLSALSHFLLFSAVNYLYLKVTVGKIKMNQ